MKQLGPTPIGAAILGPTVLGQEDEDRSIPEGLRNEDQDEGGREEENQTEIKVPVLENKD